MNKNEVVYVVKMYVFDGEEHEETLCICRDLKTAYNKIKDEIAIRKEGYLQYFEERKWRRVTDTTLVKPFEWESEFHDDDVIYDFMITRWEVM